MVKSGCSVHHGVRILMQPGVSYVINNTAYTSMARVDIKHFMLSVATVKLDLDGDTVVSFASNADRELPEPVCFHHHTCNDLS